MKRSVIVFTTLLILMASHGVSAQYGTQKKADALFNKFAFIDAAQSYQELVDHSYNTDYALRKLADCYFLLRDPERASGYYAQVVRQEGVPVEYYYNYALVLRALGKYDQALEWAKAYKQNGGETRLYRELKKDQAGNNLFESGTHFEINTVSFNSAYSDFGTYEHNGSLYFVSSRPHNELSNKIYKWNEQPFLDIFKRDEHGIAKPLPGDINSKFHEGPLTITPNGKFMYFSRNNYNEHKIGKDDKGVNHLKIYRAEMVDNTWKRITDLSVNGKDFSVAHPALSPDGKTLYFASDRPGGFGKSDLYKVAINSDGSFGEVINLGEKVNTSEDELFPFINSENTLFFSSDGHGGYGLLDIFATAKDETGAINQVINLGKPINSTMDDFSFFMSKNGFDGYFSSNRSGSTFNDDIYHFEKIPPLMLRGLVKDSINHKPIANARLSLQDTKGNEIAFLQTDASGRYEINIDRDKDYHLTVAHEKYQQGKAKIFTSRDLHKTTTEVIVNFQLVPVRDISILAGLNTIYFDFDRYEIRPDAASELDKIVNLLTNDYPDMVMKIEAHTDSRGSISYNDKLSIDRANATAEYLISKGLDKNRIIAARGYGEKKLTNGCEDGVNCEESRHQENRRTEFIVERMR